MGKGRLESFSGGVIATPSACANLAFAGTTINPGHSLSTVTQRMRT